MRRNQIKSAFTIISLFLLPIGLEWQLAVVAHTETISHSSTKVNRSSEHSQVSLTSIPMVDEAIPRISFKEMVCDLGDVGQGTKNTCEFRFTNTGRGLLKIDKISRTCGCTVFQLDKKEYAPNETGTIKVIYTAGKSTATTQKSI